jgi:hypothetical protein
MPNPFVDPVVAEIHAVRQQMLDAAGGDMDVLMRQVAERQNRSGHLIVRKRLSESGELTNPIGWQKPQIGPTDPSPTVH